MQYQNFLDVAIKAAKKAGAIQKQNHGKVKQVQFKGEINLLTEVDLACEKAIIELIEKHFPDHDILAEEGHGNRSNSGYRWIIDPLDGTTNYAHGYPFYCTSIALEYQGQVIVGVVYNPNLDELFWAVKGAGSFLNGQPIRCSETTELKKAMFATGFAYNLHETKNNNVNHFQNLLFKLQALRRDGVAALDLCYVACGRYDGFWELHLFPWDVAAGSLIVSEAGGKIDCFGNKTFSIYEKEIIATNKFLLHPTQKLLQQVSREDASVL